MADDIGGVWRTVGGRRIFIKDGDDLATAMKKSGKFKNLKDKDKDKEKTKETEQDKENRVMDDFVKNNPRWEDGEYDEDEFDDVAATLGVSRDEVADRLYDRIYEKAHERSSSPTEKSITSLNEIDRLAGDNEYLQKIGRKLGLKDFKKFLKDNPGYLKKKK